MLPKDSSPAVSGLITQTTVFCLEPLKLLSTMRFRVSTAGVMPGLRGSCSESFPGPVSGTMSSTSFSARFGSQVVYWDPWSIGELNLVKRENDPSSFLYNPFDQHCLLKTLSFLQYFWAFNTCGLTWVFNSIPLCVSFLPPSCWCYYHSSAG